MKKTKQHEYTSRVEVKLKPAEKKLIQDAAKAYGVTVSQLIRHYATVQSKFILDEEKNSSGKSINRSNQTLQLLKRALIKSQSNNQLLQSILDSHVRSGRIQHSS